MKTDKVNRFEIVDHSICKMCSGQGGTEDVSCPSCGGSGFPGRRVVFWDNSKQVKIDLQDDNRTLKVFIEDRSN